jgi:hypothetical protein
VWHADAGGCHGETAQTECYDEKFDPIVNVAVAAVANKLARIISAVLAKGRPYEHAAFSATVQARADIVSNQRFQGARATSA